MYEIVALNKRETMNKINPKKLLNSKWTALKPTKKEKHFIVIDVEYGEDDEVLECHIEAVMTKRSSNINWQELKDESLWAHGWK